MKELYNLFVEKYAEYGDGYIIDNSNLREGYYFKVAEDIGIEDCEQIIVTSTKRKEDFNPVLYDWFNERLYYGTMLGNDSNKAIDTSSKKFHSINPFTLFLKRSSLPDMLDTFEENFTSHFTIMQGLYESFDVDFKVLENRLRTLVGELTLYCQVNDIKKGTLKIFLDTDIDLTKEIFESYLTTKAFLTDRALGLKELKKHEEMLGVSSFQTALDGKKPFLFKRATSFKLPHAVTLEEAKNYSKMNNCIVPLAKDFEEIGYLAYNKERVITDYELVPKRNSLKTYIEFKILQNDNPFEIQEKQIFKQVDRAFIELHLNRMLKGLLFKVYQGDNFLENRTVITEIGILNEMLLHRDLLKNYFKKHYKTNVFIGVSKITAKILNYEILNSYLTANSNKDLRVLWDLRMSLLNYFSEKGVYDGLAIQMNEMMSSIEQEMNSPSSSFEIKDDFVFYFMLGQIAAYLKSLSSAGYKSGRLYQAYLHSISTKQIVDLIVKDISRYSYNMPRSFESKINRALQAILVYEPTENVKNREMKNIFIAGLIGVNLFYFKQESGGQA